MVTKTLPEICRTNIRAIDPSAPTNRELIDGFISGDSAAADAFHERYSNRISRWVWRLLGSDLEHEDIVQQVFVNIFKSMHKLKAAEKLESWVDSVTIRTVRYELRKRRARRALLMQGDWGADTEDTTSPFKEHHTRVFYKILNSLAADERIIFTLRFLEGCSIDYIASIGNYSRSTAKRRLNHAKSVFVQKALEDFSLVSLAEEFHAV